MDNTFTVLPMSQNFSLTPGETYTGTITVANPADATEDFEYKMDVSPYGVIGTDYTADLATMSNWTQIVDWIKIEEPTGKIAPNDTKKVTFTITVPEDAPAGGQYAAITVASNAQASQSGGVAVQNVFEMASLIYAQVAGETIHDGEILENNVPGFATTTPISVSALISNNGNVHEAATVVLSVSNMFTGEVILPNEQNEGQYTEVIMPETEKFATREINNLPMVGAVKVNQTIYYNGDVSTEERVVIICPIWFMALIVVTLAAIVTLVVRIIMKHRRRKAEI